MGRTASYYEAYDRGLGLRHRVPNAAAMSVRIDRNGWSLCGTPPDQLTVTRPEGMIIGCPTCAEVAKRGEVQAR